jgi:Dolichyl-phosphate-mannose-protein mannosyltransferase
MAYVTIKIMKKWYIIFGIVSVILFVYAVYFQAPHLHGNPLYDDATQYSQLAQNIIEYHQFSLVPNEPYFGREPGYSFFLAIIYTLFGQKNLWAVVIIQAALYVLSSVIFTKELKHWLKQNIAECTFFALLILPIVWLLHVTIIRESLALSLAILSCSALLRMIRSKTWKNSVLLGVSLGLLTYVYGPFFLFPIWILPLLFWYKVPSKYSISMLCFVAIILSPWVLRNLDLRGQPCIAGCNRADLQWAVRGEQASTLRGVEPALCLYAEYISRDYTNRSQNCNFNTVMHRLFPDGFFGSEADAALGKIGKEKIRDNFFWYIWHTLFEVVELHLPFVGGWGFFANSIIALSTTILYAGTILAMRSYNAIYPIFFSFILYTTGIFSLSDAIPRYSMPILFCYCTLACIGYYRILHHER